MSRVIPGILGLLLAANLVLAQDKPVQPLRPEKIKMPKPVPERPRVRVVPKTRFPGAPPDLLTLHEWSGQVTPQQRGFAHLGAGTIDAAQHDSRTLVVTMTSAAVAGAHPCHDSVAAQDFDFIQELELAPARVGGKLRLSVEVRATGALRSHAKGLAEASGDAAITRGPDVIAMIGIPPHNASSGQNVSVNDANATPPLVVEPGRYSLHVRFHTAAQHPRSILPCKAASADFAPDDALDPLWISAHEPFHGVDRKQFGFQVIVRVAGE